ncbi:UNVERIFIED_CONTAM: hypothetical protein FKN15_033989 [Acipenser sinensis]
MASQHYPIGLICLCISLLVFVEVIWGQSVFLPPFIVTSGRNATSFLVGNLAGVTPILNIEVPSNSTGMLPPPSCTGNSSQWQLLTGERAGNSSLKVTVHLNQSLQLCGSNPNETSCCPESLCVVQSLRVTACRNNSVEATLLVQAEIYAETPTTGNVSENKTVIPNQVYQPLGSCPCDLQAGVCDIRCCCDQECTPSLIQLFGSYCYSGVFGGNVTPLFDQLCSVQTVNKAPDWFPFLCVQSSIDNSPFLGLFYQGATINPIESPSFQTPSIVEPIVPNGYTQGSPILTENNQYFTIPQQSMIGQCVRDAPVAFLQNFKSSCVAPLTACNISQSACLNSLELSLRIINGQGGFINITVIEQLTTDLSDFVSDPNNAETLSPTQESLFPVSSNSGDLNASEQNGLCENKSLSLNYTFFWKGNSLTNITVIHLIGKVCLDANAKLPLTLTQRFSAVFVNGDATAQSNSGNPVGNGLCATAKTTPVLFGVDFTSGCILRLSLKGLSNCSQTRFVSKSTLTAANCTFTDPIKTYLTPNLREMNIEVPSNSTGMLPPPSCTGNSSQWQLLTGERAGNSSLKVTVHLNQSLQLCGSNPNETSCCPESLCVVQSLRVTACRNNSVEATLLVQAEIYAETPTTGNVSENKTVIPNQVYQPLGSCPCDLQAGVCDIRCCCDQECTPSLIQLFGSYCYSGVFGGNVTPLFDQLCSVQTVNKAPDWFPFLCVQSSIDNSPFLGLFYQGATINPIESPSFQTPSIVEPIVPNGYTQGSPILTENNQYFTIPQQSMIGQCVRDALVAFLHNFKSSCVAPLTACNISQSACLNSLELSLRIINGQGGFINITVIEQLTTDLSDFVSDPNNAETLSPTQESLFPVSSNSGDLNASEQNGLCENKSLSLNYTFFWKGNSLINITVIHLIGKVCLDANAKLPLTLTQRFSAVFVNGDATAQSNSGNPVGNGLCATAKTTPVLFGVDFTSGCILRLSLKGLSNCSQTRFVSKSTLTAANCTFTDPIKTYLTPNLRETVQKGLSSLVSATIVAKRGNPVSTDLNEWVSISMALNMSNTAADNVPGICTGVPANMNIQIITADVGVVEGVPQTEILAVEVGSIGKMHICRSNAIGRLICRSNAIGRLICRSNAIGRLVCRSNALGSLICRSNAIGRLICRSNAIGRLVCRSNAIGRLICRSNAIGRLVCRSNAIGRLVCRSNAIGRLVCKRKATGRLICHGPI